MPLLSEPDSSVPAKPSLRQLMGFFLTLGAFTFGGPAAHIAVMQENGVQRRRWITESDFLDMLAVSNLIPGPSSTELAIFIGYRLGGLPGLLLAGSCFILPAFLIVLGLSAAYVRFGRFSFVAGAMWGVKPVVIAIVAQAVWKLAPTAIKSRWLGLLCIIALAACFLGVGPVGVYLLCGLLALMAAQIPFRHLPVASPALLLTATLPPKAIVSTGSLFFAFLKIGATLFGSGYVLLAMLRSDLVLQRHWLTDAQVLDAIAIGQVTPGPVFTTATFVGYLLSGMRGALAATAGIFLPAFVLIWIVAPLTMRLRRSEVAATILNGLNVAAVALMTYAGYIFAVDAVRSPTAISIALVSAIVLIRYRINPTWLLAGAAAIGIVLSLR